jgi:hypothetical protein
MGKFSARGGDRLALRPRLHSLPAAGFTQSGNGRKACERVCANVSEIYTILSPVIADEFIPRRELSALTVSPHNYRT